MAFFFDSEIDSKTYDCMILVHPEIRVLETQSTEIQKHGIPNFNISKNLSNALMTVLMKDRGRFSQQWLMDTLVNFAEGPILCSYPNLLFEPSFEIDPLTLFRKIARIKRLLVLWPGEYASNTLSYAIPNHHHYRTWKITEDLLLQPPMKILRLPDLKGAS